ncbi:MAG: amino acid adenylation domain-containing protein, partial [Saprospiraceae bacterium]
MDNTVHSLFEQCAQRYADTIALKFKDTTLSYRELNEQANQLAHFLSTQNIDKQSLITISMDRSFEMIIAMLAIIKMGCAYVPIDPDSPDERIDFILHDTQSPLLLTSSHLIDRFKKIQHIKLIEVDRNRASTGDFPKDNLQLDIIPADLVYCIYTSGSTGKPKGILVEHRNLVNLIEGHKKRFNHPVKNFLFTYSFAFDGSVVLIFKTLLQGGRIIIAENGLEKDIHKVGRLIQKESVSHLLTFPSSYNILLENVSPDLFNTLEFVSVAGEACPGALVKLHHHIVPHAKLFNEYGPTEATVGATIFETSKDHHGSKTPIGTCIDHVFIFLLNEELAQVRTGETGEIFIGGKGVSRGYLNRPKLTKEKFIKNPFGEGRLYKTGDLARQLPDGNFDFIGRADFQVKLRGYRIELGEVESVILQHDKIRETVVILHGKKAEDQKLLAYIVAARSQKILSGEIRAFLEKQLPEYMLPSTFIFLEKMPLSTNGKIDRKALPAPADERPDLEVDYIAPSTYLEIYIFEKWSNLLNINKIGINDKFFELGGNSLLAAKFIADIQQALGENIFITSIFENPTIASFSNLLQRDYKEALALKQASLKQVCNLRSQAPLNQNTTQDSHFPTRPRLPLPDAVGTISSKQDNVEFGLSLSEERRTITFLNTKDFTNFQNLIPEHKKSTLKTTKNPPAIFILSPPRSGTTLLRVMLAGHPDIFSANELQVLHFDDLQERAKAYEGKFSLWKEGSIRALMALKNIEADEAKYLMQKEEETATSSQEFYRNIQNLLDGKILVDKSPSYILDKNALQRAEDIFENAFYIHLYRHPYSMTKSFEKMHMDQVMYLKKHNYSARQLGELIWQQSHQNAIDFLNHIPKHRQFNISYETLISDPETSMKNLCERFGIDFHLNLLKPYEGLDHKMTDGIYKDSKPMGDINLLQHGKINPDLANKWKGVLHDNFLHENTWKTAKALGYPEVESSQGLKESSAQETPLKQVSNLRPQSNPLQGEADLRSLPQNKDIAIIGLSVRFPGAKDLEEFWQNLIQAKDISREFTAEELLAEGIDPQTINDPDYIRRGMYLEDADCFDAEFFGYLPKEAALMDPQHRVFLECAYASLEDAGYDPERTNLNIGVFGGVARNTYLINNVLTHPNYFNSLDDFQLGITLEKDFPATRVAYKLNLKGPAVNVQTACSSSGVAVHLACQSIRAGDSDIVIVGGGRIQPPIASGHLHKEGHALSPDGYCRTFDAGANGMVRGHGMSFIVLKNLDKAIADGDNIHAIIKGTAINNDGADKIGFTAPSIKGQSEAIIKAYQNAGINPETLSYIEAHGTGTAIGDPIEIA